jgi:Flp pilus assembly protein TadG
MVVVFGFASLSLDYGKVQTGKTELRRAADAAARAASTYLGNYTTVQNTAYAFAYANLCDGTPIVIDKNADVEFWDYDSATRTHTVLSGANRNRANAVKVTCRRTLPLVAARAVGATSCDVSASAVVALMPPGYGLVGINSITLKGNSSASWWSSTGVTGGNSGHIASNGPITSTSNAQIAGTIWHLPGQPISSNITPTAVRNLTSPLSYPNGSSGPYNGSFNDNATLPSGVLSGTSVSVNSNKTYTVAAGNYVVNNFTLSGTINCTGPVVFYVYGTVNIGGQATTHLSQPKNLKLVMIHSPWNNNPPGSVTIGSGSAFYADIYGPESDITLSGSGAIYGAIVGKTVTATGSSDIYYDLSLTGGNGSVQVIQSPRATN